MATFITELEEPGFMRYRTIATRLLLAAMLGLGISVPALAQEPLPAGVSLDIAANAVIERVPEHLDQTVLYRLELAPEAIFPIEPAQDGIALAEVTQGEMSATVDAPLPVSRANAEPGEVEEAPAGEAITLEPGDSALFGTELTGELRAVGAEATTLLVLEAISPTDAGDEEPSPLPEGVTVEFLATGATPDLDEGAILLWIGEFALEPGTTFAGQAQPGVEIASGLAGTFTMAPTDGPGLTVLRQFVETARTGENPTIEQAATGDIVTFSGGDAVYFPDGNLVDISNEGDIPAIALFGGIGPAPNEEA